MALQLVVREPFLDFKMGDHITDPALVAKYQTSHPAFVIRKVVEDTPSAQTSPQPSAASGSKSSPTPPNLSATS